MWAFWILHVLIWSAVVVYGTSGTWAMVRSRAIRRGDPMRLACFVVGLIMIGFTVRWMVLPESIILWQSLYILSCATALYILRLMRVYGRGPIV